MPHGAHQTTFHSPASSIHCTLIFALLLSDLWLSWMIVALFYQLRVYLSFRFLSMHRSFIRAMDGTHKKQSMQLGGIETCFVSFIFLFTGGCCILSFICKDVCLFNISFGLQRKGNSLYHDMFDDGSGICHIFVVLLYAVIYIFPQSFVTPVNSIKIVIFAMTFNYK